MKAKLYKTNGKSGYTVKTLEVNGSEFFLEVDEKRTYRFSVDKEGNIFLPLINGCDLRVTQAYGYPAIKIIGEQTKYPK